MLWTEQILKCETTSDWGRNNYRMKNRAFVYSSSDSASSSSRVFALSYGLASGSYSWSGQEGKLSYVMYDFLVVSIFQV